MKIKKIIGYFLLSLPFIAAAILLWILTGHWWTPVVVYGIAVLFAVLVAAGQELIDK